MKLRDEIEEVMCKGMKKEEVIRRIRNLRNFLASNYSDIGEPNIAAFNVAIKALKQEPILDTIRAEIKDWQTDIHDNEYDAEKHDFVFEQIYEIIDKYKAESEE